ncbi:MAG: hypothetical protein KKB20_01930 [Proteobacteria bacterium]|nr:hypothetical protein [Pseudomonadota bacterium]
MNSIFILLFWAVIVIVGYFFYSKYINAQVFEADSKRATPATMYMDGVDFMPANRNVLYGFQLNSIAGAAPIIGPIIALKWGWLPAVLWLGFGVLLIGWLHDYASCMVSIRSDGDTFGALSYRLISPRARKILISFIYFYLLLIAAAFGDVIATLLSKQAAQPFPMLVIVAVAFLVGHLIYRTKFDILWTTVIAIVLIFASIAVAPWLPIKGNFHVMLIAVLIFGLVSAVLPVWRFIQPFNYASVYVVYFGIIAGVLGVLIGAKPVTLPAFTQFNIGAGPLWPLLFVTIACGAISGWHSLVSSTGTSRQIENEIHVRPVTAGAMFAEFTIAIIAVIITATAFSGSDEYLKALAGGPAGIFVTGLGGALTTLGIPVSFAKIFGGTMILVLALTVINLVFRFMKVASSELLGERLPIAKNQYVSTIVALLLTFILIETGTFKYVWILFGGANQLMAGLALMIVTLWLAKAAKSYAFALYPAIFMYVTTVAALLYTSIISLIIPILLGKVTGSQLIGNLIAGLLGLFLAVNAVILAYDGVKAFYRYKTAKAEGAPVQA